jgi:small GTP-binding protein
MPIADTAEAASLDAVLDRLSVLLPAADRAQLAALRERLRQGRLRTLVAGESKRGKSTLLNVLLGRDVLPTGVLPLTAVTTTVTAGEEERVEATFADGRVETHTDLAVLDGLVTEAGNPRNARAVARVVVRLRHPLLAAGLELVDTPGTGSIHEHNTDAARGAVQDMDFAVFVTSATPPVSASERAFLREVRQLAVRTLVVLTKIDLLDPAELTAVTEFTAHAVGEVLGGPVRVHAVSSREAQAARRTGDPERLASSGLPELERVLGAAAAERSALLQASVRGQAARFAAAAASDAELTARAARLDAADLAQRQAEFRTRLAAVRLLAGEATALLHAEIRRLIQQTTDEAQTEASHTVRQAVAAGDRWAGEHPDSQGRELEDGARAAALGIADASVLAWRDRRQAELDRDLAALTARLESRLAEQVEAVRAAAAEVFDLAPGPPPPAGALAARSAFRLATADQAGVTDLLAAAVRTRLPGRLGRRRVLAHLRDELSLAVDAQFGRARADFQARLQETGRILAAALAARLDDAIARVQDAVDRGSHIAALRATARDRAAAKASDRADTLRELAAAIGGV